MFQTPELIIIDELKDLLYSDVDCTPLNIPLVWRNFRTNNQNVKINCPSCNENNNPNYDSIKECIVCQGESYLWDEKIITGWLFRANLRTAHSLESPENVGMDIDKTIRLVTVPPVFINIGDKIKVLKLNENKKIYIPITYYETYTCASSQRYSSNQSNSEFNIAGLSI